MKKFKSIVETYLNKSTNFVGLTCDEKEKLKINNTCNSVQYYINELVPSETYEADGTSFLNGKDMIKMNLVHYPGHLGFPFGYLCFAIDSDWESWVFESTSGKVMKITYEAFSDEDYIIDINNELEELDYNKENFHKGFNKLDIYPDLETFFNYKIIEHKFATGEYWGD